jgi:hypothetical protein
MMIGNLCLLQKHPDASVMLLEWGENREKTTAT